ncbi:unnamed protein product [Musa acuminata var. zebrina]
MKMAVRAKKMMEWTKMAMPLVWRVPNSTSRPLPGIWNNKPGESSTKSTTATNTGPQSAISLSLSLSLSLDLSFLVLLLMVVSILQSLQQGGEEDKRLRDG